MQEIKDVHMKKKITGLMILYGVCISVITPILVLISEYITLRPLYYLITTFGFFVQFFLIYKLISLWEKSSHIIYHDEETELLKMIQNIQGDIVAYNEYFESFLKSKISEEARHEIYVTLYETDVKIGFSKILFNKEARSGTSYFSVPPYAELILKKTDAIAPFFSVHRRFIDKSDIKSLITYGNVSLPGSMIFPLINNERGVLGLWVLYFPENKEIKRKDSPSAVLLSARFLLEDILTILFYKEKPLKSASPVQQNQYLLMYNQIINVINVVVHEIQTPASIMKSYLSLIKKRGGITIQEINLLLEQLNRISKRLSKMMFYANALLPKTKNESHEPEAVKVKFVIDWLKDNYKSVLQSIGNEKKLTITLSAAEEALYKEVDNNPLVLQAFFEILENAVIYSTPKSIITIKVGVQKSAESISTVFFIFQNSGMIPSDILENYKKIAVTGDFKSHSSLEHGAGFGLAMANMIISQTKGKMVIKNDMENRVTIRIDLPIL